VNGDIYEGEWSQDKVTGQGKYTWAEGGEYEGEFLDEALHGQGKRVWPDTG